MTSLYCECGAQWHGVPHTFEHVEQHRYGGKGHGLITHKKFKSLGNDCYCNACKRARIISRIESLPMDGVK